MIYNQLDNRWSKQILGFNPINSTYTIGNYGCLITSLCTILFSFGINTSPSEINNELKNRQGFVKNSGNYIWGAISNIYPSIREEVFWSSDLNIIITALKEGKQVMVEVDGNMNTTAWNQHFSSVDSVDKGIIYLSDPWGGVKRPLSYYKNIVKKIIIYTNKTAFTMTEEQKTSYIRIIQGNEIGTPEEKEQLVNALLINDYSYFNTFYPEWIQKMATHNESLKSEIEKINITVEQLKAEIEKSNQLIIKQSETFDWQKFLIGASRNGWAYITTSGVISGFLQAVALVQPEWKPVLDILSYSLIGAGVIGGTSNGVKNANKI